MGVNWQPWESNVHSKGAKGSEMGRATRWVIRSNVPTVDDAEYMELNHQEPLRFTMCGLSVRQLPNIAWGLTELVHEEARPVIPNPR